MLLIYPPFNTVIRKHYKHFIVCNVLFNCSISFPGYLRTVPIHDIFSTLKNCVNSFEHNRLDCIELPVLVIILKLSYINRPNNFIFQPLMVFTRLLKQQGGRGRGRRRKRKRFSIFSHAVFYAGPCLTERLEEAMDGQVGFRIAKSIRTLHTLQ